MPSITITLSEEERAFLIEALEGEYWGDQNRLADAIADRIRAAPAAEPIASRVDASVKSILASDAVSRGLKAARGGK